MINLKSILFPYGGNYNIFYTKREAIFVSFPEEARQRVLSVVDHKGVFTGALSTFLSGSGLVYNSMDDIILPLEFSSLTRIMYGNLKHVNTFNPLDNPEAYSILKFLYRNYFELIPIAWRGCKVTHTITVNDYLIGFIDAENKIALGQFLIGIKDRIGPYNATIKHIEDKSYYQMTIEDLFTFTDFLI